MNTALYEGRRVQVIDDSIPMVMLNGKWHPVGEQLVIIRELGENIVAGVDSTTGVEPSELSDYLEFDETPPKYVKSGQIVMLNE
jgi:hypothetical protein